MDFRVLLVFVMVFASWATAEIIKFIVDASVNKRADVRIFLGYGGFPSAHSALVSSLCTSLLLIQGFSVSFAISLVLAGIVLRDTVTIRQYIDRNTKQIARLSRHLTKEETEIELISHSLMEISVGIAIGIVVPAILYLVLL